MQGWQHAKDRPGSSHPHLPLQKQHRLTSPPHIPHDQRPLHAFALKANSRPRSERSLYKPITGQGLSKTPAVFRKCVGALGFAADDAL
jgi:hypothetical protein